jgi:hypothetical protein
MSRSYLEVFSSLEENQVQRLTFRGLNRRLLVEGENPPKLEEIEMARHRWYEPQDELFIYMDEVDQHEEGHEEVMLSAQRVLDKLFRA